MDIFLLQLAIIFVPGFVWEGLDARFGRPRGHSQFDVILRAFIFGLAAYFATFLAYSAAGRSFSFLAPTAGGTFLTEHFLDEILVALIVSVVLAVLWLYSENYKLLARFLQAIDATKRYGDEDVWDYTFNAPSGRVEYVHVRDHKKERVFCGWVQVFSETARLRELVLRDVEVYDLEGLKLYEVPLMYLSRAVDDVEIEFPATEQNIREVADV